MAVKFIKSAVLPQDFPPDQGIEIAFAGRSNAGKSSLINVLNNHRIAHVSNTPGKTRLLNFFDVNGKYTMVDMPGYGYASRSGDEIHEWQKMIEHYLLNREALRGLVLVMDSRREWSDDEELMKRFAEEGGFDMAVVLTKVDKLKRNDIAKTIASIKRASRIKNVFAVSSLKKTGSEEFEEWLYTEWIKPTIEGSP